MKLIWVEFFYLGGTWRGYKSNLGVHRGVQFCFGGTKRLRTPGLHYILSFSVHASKLKELLLIMIFVFYRWIWILLIISILLIRCILLIICILLIMCILLIICILLVKALNKSIKEHKTVCLFTCKWFKRIFSSY